MKHKLVIPSIRFRVRREKSKSPIIQCHISLYGQDSPRFSTQIKVDTGLSWHQKKQHFIQNNPVAYANNGILNEIKAKILDCFTLLSRKKEPMSAYLLKDEFVKIWKQKEKIYTIRYLFTNFLEYTQQRNIEKKTLSKYLTCEKHLQDFLKKQYGRNDLDLSQIDAITGYRFFEYLIKKVCESTANRYLQYLKACLEHSIKEGLINSNPLMNARPKVKHNPVNKTMVTEAQQLTILNLDNLTTIEQHVADITTFMFYTTYDHCDYWEFRKKIHIVDVDGVGVMRKKRFKQRKSENAKVCTVIVNDAMKGILDRIEDSFPLYPAKTILEIYRSLCSRIGVKNFERIGLKQIRKSGATYYLNNDVPLKVVSESILGHTTVTMTEKHYTKIEENTVLRHIKHLSARL